jgi:hypothetical protein
VSPGQRLDVSDALVACTAQHMMLRHCGRGTRAERIRTALSQRPQVGMQFRGGDLKIGIYI